MHPASFAFVFFGLFHPFSADDPNRLELLLNKGDTYYRAFDNAGALVEYCRAYDLAPESLSTLLRMVRTYNDMGRLKLGEDSLAQTYYQKSVGYAQIMTRLFPNRPESHFWLALGRGSLIRFSGISDKIHIGKEVQEEAKKAIELDSTFSYAYVILGNFEREGAKLSWFERTVVRVVFGHPISGSLEEAERLLLLALTYDRNNSYAFYELYWTYSAMGKNDKALEALRSLCSLSPSNARELQQRDEALDILKKQNVIRTE